MISLLRFIVVNNSGFCIIIKGERGITADTAIRFSKFFDMSPEFRMNLQREYDLRKAREEIKEIVDHIVPVSV